MSSIRYSMKEPAVRVLGPGRRFALWVQGCDRACPGCIAPDAHDPAGGASIEVDALAWEIALSGADGLSISGGEPFLQAGALAELVRLVRRQRDLGVIAYTGFTLEELAGVPDARALLACTDLLVDGAYVRELDDGRGVRGSANQRLLPLTDRYRELTGELERCERAQETFPHGPEIHVAGIPGRGGYRL